MAGIRDLDVLLRSLSPSRRPGEFVYVEAEELPAGVVAEATIREAEGLGAVVRREDADRHGLAYDFVGAWITLEVHSALDAVGLTAAVATALAAAGISGNVIAGLRHDHVLVPAGRAGDALAVLGRLGEAAGADAGGA